MKTTEIIFTPGKLAQLRVAYFAALKSGEEQFTFEGNEYVTEYARYLIEYLDGQFNRQRKPQ